MVTVFLLFNYTKHYLRWQKRLAGFVPGNTRTDVPISPNQNHRAPPDQEAQKPGSTGAAGSVIDPDGDHSGGV